MVLGQLICSDLVLWYFAKNSIILCYRYFNMTLIMYFEPWTLHIPAELCSRMIIKYVNLVVIGKISPRVP